MNQSKARAARKGAAATTEPEPFWTTGKVVVVVVVVAAVIGATFAVPRLTGGSRSARHTGMVAMGAGPALGSVPRFAERDVVTGRAISSRTLQGQKTLLFFSEGVMCQACLQQIRDIDDVGAMLERRHVRLVSVTTDSHGELMQAIRQYGIASPMIADSDRSMSTAFNMLGRGMHADTPGHAFVLIDGRGHVLWQRDYYQAPYRTMYVRPADLFKDIPSSS